jgi:hypothetical protein
MVTASFQGGWEIQSLVGEKHLVETRDSLTNEMDIEMVQQSLSHPPVVAYLGTGKQDTKAFQEEICVSVPAADQQIHIQRLRPENKGALPSILV